MKSKQIIRLTESDLHRIIKKTVKRIIKEQEEFDKFTMDMNKLYNIVGDEIGGDSIKDTITGYIFDFDSWTDYDSNIVPCKFSENRMFYLAYDICNYDLICLNDDGTVDIENSNHPDIAQLIAPYLSKESGMKIVHNLYGR